MVGGRRLMSWGLPVDLEAMERKEIMVVVLGNTLSNVLILIQIWNLDVWLHGMGSRCDWSARGAGF